MSEAIQPIVMRLKLKYRLHFKPKNGGKKRQSSNSGGVGERGKALKRARVISSRTGGGEQYRLWARAMEHQSKS